MTEWNGPQSDIQREVRSSTSRSLSISNKMTIHKATNCHRRSEYAAKPHFEHILTLKKYKKHIHPLSLCQLQCSSSTQSLRKSEDVQYMECTASHRTTQQFGPVVHRDRHCRKEKFILSLTAVLSDSSRLSCP